MHVSCGCTRAKQHGVSFILHMELGHKILTLWCYVACSCGVWPLSAAAFRGLVHRRYGLCVDVGVGVFMHLPEDVCR